LRRAFRICAQTVDRANPIDIPPRQAVLIVCTLILLALVYAEGWTWPLKAAACMIPVSLLVG
jgi:hypothetical protein